MSQVSSASLFALLAVGAPNVAQAQRPQASVLFRATQEAPAVERRSDVGIFGDGSSDHRYTGMWVGLGVGVGIPLLWFASCAIDHRDNGCRVERPAALAVSVPILAVSGALIGGLFPKSPRRVESP